MRVIISPAKQMKVDMDAFTCTEVPVLMEKTEILKNWISGLSYEEKKTLWACNEKITKQNAERFSDMNLHRNLTPAFSRRTASGTCWNETGNCLRSSEAR